MHAGHVIDLTLAKDGLPLSMVIMEQVSLWLLCEYLKLFRANDVLPFPANKDEYIGRLL